MSNKLAKVEIEAARLAASRHGIASAARLVALGLSRATIAERVRSGRLHRIHRGVYAVGHRALSRHGHWMAAVLACGDGAAPTAAPAGPASLCTAAAR